MGKRNADGPQDRYVKLHHYLLKTEAWLALSPAARAIYVQIAFRYNGSNNGKIAYSSRDAAKECGLARNTAMRAFKELIALGFIEETRHGSSLSRKTRLASEWRLTAFRCDLTGSSKTCAFMQRGPQARDSRQPRSRPSRARPIGETPLETLETLETPPTGSNDGREWLKTDTRPAQTRASETPEWLKRGPVKPVFGVSTGSNDDPHIVYHPPILPETLPDGQIAVAETPPRPALADRCRFCPECQSEMTDRPRAAKFCSPACRLRSHRRRGMNNNQKRKTA